MQKNNFLNGLYIKYWIFFSIFMSIDWFTMIIMGEFLAQETEWHDAMESKFPLGFDEFLYLVYLNE